MADPTASASLVPRNDAARRRLGQSLRPRDAPIPVIRSLAAAPPKAAPRSWGEFGMARPLFDLRGRGIDLRVPLSLNAATEVAMSLFEVLSSVLLSIAANQDAGT